MKYKPWPKRDSVKNYFQLPNEIFLLGLSSGALAVYSYLLCCENRETYQCWPSYNTIGKAVKMSTNTVRKYVCKLEERQLISTEGTTVTTRDGLKRNGNLLYTIHPIRLALDQFYEQQLAQMDVVAKRQRVSEVLALRSDKVTACALPCGLTGAERVTSRPLLPNRNPAERLRFGEEEQRSE